MEPREKIQKPKMTDKFEICFQIFLILFIFSHLSYFFLIGG